MRTLPEARELAEAMRELGTRAGREVVCLLTDMDQPLGRAVGNALEIHEALATVRGNGPPDFAELVLAAASRLVALSDLGLDESAARARVEAAIADGSAEEAYRRWIAAQGGDPSEDRLPTAPVVRAVEVDAGGVVARVRALAVGVAALELGAGRRSKGDEIDHSVGLVLLKKRGDRVEPGEPIAEIHARDHASAEEAGRRVRDAFELGDEAPEASGVVLDVIG
jgi:pyrimidine-nucleoside phosphorylase